MTIRKRDSLAYIKRSESERTPGILVVGWSAASKTAPANPHGLVFMALCNPLFWSVGLI